MLNEADLQNHHNRCVQLRHEFKVKALDHPILKEQDRVVFKAHGFDCLIVRGPLGAWCGYVGLPPSHPMHGKHYDVPQVQIHGGLTYSEFCHATICHNPLAGEIDQMWWFGFDCAHAFDEVPSMRILGMHESFKMFVHGHDFMEDHYWTEEEVMHETKELARQFREMAF